MAAAALATITIIKVFRSLICPHLLEMKSDLP
jgi:hypothetical protein